MKTNQLTTTNTANFIHSLDVQVSLILMDLIQLKQDLKQGLITCDEYKEEKALLQAEIASLR